MDTELSWVNFLFPYFFLFFFSFGVEIKFSKNFLIISAEMSETADLYPFLFSPNSFYISLHHDDFFMMKICEKSRFNFIHHKMTLDFILLPFFSFVSWKFCMKYKLSIEWNELKFTVLEWQWKGKELKSLRELFNLNIKALCCASFYSAFLRFWFNYWQKHLHI